jgi:hypothetical protein
MESRRTQIIRVYNNIDLKNKMILYYIGMPKRVDNYDNERTEILNSLFNILNINDKNNMFSLKHLDNNSEQQTKILELIPNIKKYFICSKWSCFNQKLLESKRLYLSIIKNLLKNMNYVILPVRKHLKDNNIAYRDTIYYINKHNMP